MEHQQVCRMCCGCGDGYTYANPFNTKTFTTDIMGDSDADSADDNHDHDNDQLVRRN